MGEDLSIDNVSQAYVSRNEHLLQATAPPYRLTSSNDNGYASFQEVDRGSSLAIQTGVGNRDASYSPGVHEEREVVNSFCYVYDRRSPVALEATSQCSVVKSAIEHNNEVTNHIQRRSLSEHQPLQEEDKHSSLEVETGSGRVGTHYPSTVHEHSIGEEVSEFSHIVSMESVNMCAQTARVCTNPHTQEPHSPLPETLDGPYEQCEALALPKSTLLTAKCSQRQLQPRSENNNYGFVRVLPPPSQLGYDANISGLVAEPNPDDPIAVIQYPLYATIEARLMTFAGWPHRMPSPHAVASAGLFYLGQEESAIDTVCCYKCGKCMCGFTPNDNPHEEHRKCFPNCSKTMWV